MPTGLFRALDADWTNTCRSRTRGTIPCAWRDDAVLHGFERLDELIAAVRAGCHDPEATDQILAALARRVATDDLAARALLQAVLPGLWNVAKRLGHARVDDELEADVLMEATDRIRTYPIERRPRAIAANITWDVFGRIYRRRHRPQPATLSLETHDIEQRPNDAAPDPSVEVVSLIADARSRRRLADADAQLLLAIAVGDDTIRARAAREGTTYAAMCERWCRARRRLRHAVAA